MFCLSYSVLLISWFGCQYLYNKGFYVKIQISFYNGYFLFKIIRLNNSGPAFSPGNNQQFTRAQPLISSYWALWFSMVLATSNYLVSNQFHSFITPTKPWSHSRYLPQLKIVDFVKNFHLVSEISSMNIIFYYTHYIFILTTMKLKKVVFFKIFHLPNLFINLGISILLE